MSELQAQPAVRDNLPGSDMPRTAEPEPQEESKSFWEVAAAAFRSRVSNLVAVSWIGFLLLVAIFVPFIANGQPYTIEMLVKGTWVRRWPLFDSLTRLDVSLLVTFAGAVTYAFIFRAGRRVGERDERMARRFWWLGAVAASILAMIVGITSPVIWPSILSVWKMVRHAYTLPSPAVIIGTSFLILLFIAMVAGVVFGVVKVLVRNSVKTNAVLLAVIAACYVIGLAIDPGVKLSPYDYRAYQEMLKDGTARGAVFAPLHWSYSEQEPLMQERTFEFPTRDHWLGTDGIGRDALSRLLWSMRVVMGIGFIAESISLFLGVVVGSLMGYFAGKTDLLGMRLVEVFESIPTFILILIFVASFGRDIVMIMVILGLTGWTGIARFVRAEFLKLRNLDYAQAAIALGLPVHRILFRHILPNGLTPVIVTVTFGVAGAIMSESGLSFLGVGIEPPTPSWGSMLNEAGNPAETFRWWLAIAPGFMIFLTVLAYNIIGEGLRDSIDPRLNKVR